MVWLRGWVVLLLLLVPRLVWADECVHIVRSGDTLSRIAFRHGVAEADLISANPDLVKNPDLLRIGQQIDVCAAQRAARASRRSTREAPKATGPRCGRSGRLLDHTIKSGETLSKIAAQYGVSESDLGRHNAALAANPHQIRAGDSIKVCVDSTRVRNHKACNYETPLHLHEVVPGEHLGQIAGRYGVRRQAILDLNHSLRANPNLLRVGQSLRVCPNIAPRQRIRLDYRVKDGDTFGGIAQAHGLTYSELVRYQRGKLSNPSDLKVGQALVIWTDGGIVPGFGKIDDDVGTLAAGVLLPPGRHYTVKWQTGAWGTAKTIRTIQSAIATYQARKPGGPKVYIADISKKGGGKFPPHVSHQHGRDADIGYVLKGAAAGQRGFRSVNAENLDVPRTWALIRAFLDTNHVRYIFMDYQVQKLLYDHARTSGVSEEILDEYFQYPRGKGRSHGMIRHWKGHRNHFHVRFDP